MLWLLSILLPTAPHAEEVLLPNAASMNGVATVRIEKPAIVTQGTWENTPEMRRLLRRAIESGQEVEIRIIEFQ
jgi:hypothetical protein